MTLSYEAWECRYILPTLPAGFARADLVQRFPASHIDDLREVDVYLLGRTPSVNVKLRRRTNALKVKVRRARTDDGLERWTTDMDTTLPVAKETWHEVLRLVGVNDADPNLHACSNVNAALEALSRMTPALDSVVVDKHRATLVVDGMRLETATVSAGDRRFASFAAEAADPDAIRRVLKTLKTAELGRPTNYIEVLVGAA